MITRRAFWLTPTVAFGAASDPRVMIADLRTGGPYKFPPQGRAYRENGASHRIWRRVLIEAPDVIVVPGGEDFGLKAAGVPIVRDKPGNITRSARHEEQTRLMKRPPKEWMTQLAGQYGQELREMVYTLSFSVWGRLRAGQVEAVRPILEPFLNGRIDSLGKPSASHYSGHLALASLFEITGDTRAKDRVVAAANLAIANPMHNEMSDAVFMVCPLLAKAGRFTGEDSYFDAALRHFDVMRKLCLRPDGLYRHSPLDEAAWGRGNAFPLLGLALTLTDMPVNRPAYVALRDAYGRHADRLLAAQSNGGCWRQVVDKEDAWEEFTATAMIGWALRRGIDRKWLRGKKYQNAVNQAWKAVQRRTGADGVLIDVCESTGKRKTLADYYNREAIRGKDPRGGAMALQFAAEMTGAKA